MLVCQLASVAVWFGEVIFRSQQSPRDHAYLLGHSFLVVMSWATLLGIALELVRWSGARLEALSRGKLPTGSAFWLCGLVICHGLGVKASQGAWISRQAIAPYGGWIVMAFGGLALGIVMYADVKLTRSPRRYLRFLWIGLLVALAIVLIHFDLSLLPSLYGYLHDTLAATAWLAVARSLWLAAEDLFDAAARSPRLSYAIVAGAALLSSTIPISFVARASTEARVLWASTPLLSGRLHQKASTAADFVRSTKRYQGAYVDSVASFAAADANAAQLGPDETLQAWRSLQRCTASSGEQTANRPHIVLITVDALRSDVAQAEGTSYARIGKRGLRFDHAFAPSASTAASVPAMFYGAFDWRKESTNLVDALRSRGYVTAMITARMAFDYLRIKNMNFLNDFHEHRLSGVSKSAGQLVDGAPEYKLTSQAITDDAIAMLSSARTDPIFLWVHYFDLHEWSHAGHKELEGRARYIAHWLDVDREVGRLLDTIDLTSAGAAVVAFSSDHGEYLGERGRWGHTQSVGLPVIQIPMAIYGPTIAPQQRSEIASLTDIAPTVAALAGASWSARGGCDLRQPKSRSALLVASDSVEMAIVSHDRVLVAHPQMRSVELYDFRNDPTVQHNLVNVETELRTSLLKALLGSPAARAGTSMLVQ